MNRLSEFWERLQKREKLLVIGTVGAILFYVTYNMMLEKTFTQVIKSRRELAKVETEYKQLLVYHQLLEQFKKEQKMLEISLEKKKLEESRFMEGLKARHHLDKLLLELEATAKKMPMQLMNLDVSTGVITRSKDYQREKVQGATNQPVETTPSNAAKGDKETVSVTYTQNQIKLTYRSTYQSSVKYMLKIVELPYAISILSSDMKRLDIVVADLKEKKEGGEGKKESGSAASAARQFLANNEIMLETTIELEAYYR
jgi:hypothetical protein